MSENESVTKRLAAKGLKEFLPLAYLVIALLALRWTVVEPYVVPTGSMEPTLKKGDRLYALKCAYDVRFPFTDWILFRTGTVERGDVILFRAPREPDKTYVKRVLGLPGDEISFIDGTLYLNGEAVERKVAPSRDIMYDIEYERFKRLFIEDLTGVKHWVILDEAQPHHRDFPRYRIPEGHFFAVGDNRDHSSDSREWGLVPYKLLKGEAMFIWYSSWDWRPRGERIGTLIQ